MLKVTRSKSNVTIHHVFGFVLRCALFTLFRYNVDDNEFEESEMTHIGSEETVPRTEKYYIFMYDI